MDSKAGPKKSSRPSAKKGKKQHGPRKQRHSPAQETVREQLDAATHCLELAEVLLVELDNQARVTMVGGIGYKVLGYTEDEIIGANWFDLCLPPDQVDEVQAVYRKLLSGKTRFIEYYENQVLTKSGEVRYIAWHNSLVRDRDGKVTGTLSAGIDITERVEVMRELAKNDMQFRNIIDASPVPYALNDAQQNITYLNAAFVRTFGYDSKDIPTLDDWWPKAYPDEEYRQWVATTWQARLKQAEKDKSEFEPLELTIRCKDGTDRIVMASAAMVGEKLKGNHLVILYDITELKRADQARLESETGYRTIVETAQEGIWTIDAKNHTSFVNPKMADILGYTESEMQGRSMYEFMDEEGRAIAEQNVKRREAGIAEQHDFKFIKKNGEAVWTELNTSPLYDRQGEYAGALAMVTDITSRYQSMKALQESEEKYRNLFENMTTGFALHEIICDEEGKPCNYRYIELNPAFEKLTGVTASQLLGKTILDVLPNTEKYWIEIFGRVAQTGEPMAYENFSRELGKYYDTWVFSPKQNQFAVIFSDTTERKKAETENKALAERLALATRAANMGIWDWDVENDELTWDDRMFELYAVDKSEFGAVYDAWLARVHPDDQKLAEKSIRDAIEKGARYDIEFRVIWPDGSIHHIKADGQVVTNDEGKVVRMIGVNYDTSDRADAEERLRFMAHHDDLTGLPNRPLFMDRLNNAMGRARRNKTSVALFFMDLDRFKNINDTFGHETGDQFLKLIAERLKQDVRTSDTVARFGGDEFAVLLEVRNGIDDVVRVAKKILEVLSLPFNINGQDFYATTSIGISLYPNDADDAPTLLKHSDTAMYRAKELGRNNYQFYSKDLSARALERLNMEIHIRRALENKEFEIYFQPQFDLRSKRVVALEALLRWNHPERGLVLPGSFISLAEETGLIVPLGNWVLRETCRQLCDWRQQGLPIVPVTVNLSGRQFVDRNLVELITGIISERKMDPGLLELEITEGVMMHNPEVAIHTLTKLSDMGIRIAVDDFGTGYSSLSYLKRYPINTLKIDQSFVRDINTDPSDRSIVMAIIAMAHSMDLRVVAEGVETDDQLEFLAAQDCDVVQGFLFSHPISSTATGAWLSRQA